jgi:hypothetical protein
MFYDQSSSTLAPSFPSLIAETLTLGVRDPIEPSQLKTKSRKRKRKKKKKRKKEKKKGSWGYVVPVNIHFSKKSRRFKPLRQRHTRFTTLQSQNYHGTTNHAFPWYYRAT